jgi:hypothetical protein
MEILNAYYPDKMRLWGEAGPEFDDSLNIPWYELLGRKRARDVWIRRLFCALLYSRDDLVVTGHNLEQGLYAPRSILPRHLFLTAYSHDGIERDGRDILITFDIPAETVVIRYWSGTDKESRQRSGLKLVAMRIEVATDWEGRWQPAASQTEKPQSQNAKAHLKQDPTDAQIEQWQRNRCEAWPAELAPSTGPKCLAAAKAHFGCAIGRDRFYGIRERVVPLPWRKPGPRR